MLCQMQACCSPLDSSNSSGAVTRKAPEGQAALPFALAFSLSASSALAALPFRFLLHIITPFLIDDAEIGSTAATAGCSPAHL